MALIDDLWILWKKYIDYFVVGNTEQKKLYFHIMLGCYLTDKGFNYLESGQPKSVRMHVFSIQNSGTGKGQLMGSLHRMLTFLGMKSRKTIKDNEAALTGSVFRDKTSGKTIIKKGLLAELIASIWLEGSILLKETSYMDVMTDVFQVVMDEPGEVSKGMKLGVVEYPTPATIIAGSYMFREFKSTLMKKGFLQRMFISYKVFTEKEERDIRIGVNQLKTRRNPEKIEQCMVGLKMLLDRVEIRDGPIRFNDLAVREFNDELEKVYQEYVHGQFVGEKQDTLKTFFNRFHCLIDKFASQVAIINGKDEVGMEELNYARTICEYHLNSILSIFDSMETDKNINVVDNRENIILGMVRKGTGRITQRELLDDLRQLKKRGNWDLGHNRSAIFLQSMVEDKLINFVLEKNNKKVYYI